MCEQTTLNRIIKAAQNLSEDEAMEALHFMEYLTTKRKRGEDETTYLLKEPANAKDLLEAIQDLREGRYQARELLPDD